MMVVLAMLVGSANAQTLSMDGTCPGTVGITVDGLTPGGNVVLMGSSNAGAATVPMGGCSGVPTALADDFRHFGPFEADGDGAFTVSPTVGAGIADMVVQALDLETCGITEAVALCGDGAAPIDFEARHGRVDVAMLLDTTCSMSGAIMNWQDAFPGIATTLLDGHDSVTFGLATYDDYNDGSFGSGDDKPFILLQQQTTDTDMLRAALAPLAVHNGADGPESGHEAIYQAMTGLGYDQDCDGRYDGEDDVRPFGANPLDAFRGLVPGIEEPGTPGTGTLGGMGFRDGALPIVVLTTDNQLRDPDDGYASPGGCSLDAGFYDAYTGLAELGGRFVGVNVSAWNDIGNDQLEALAIVSDSFGDLDGDGVDEPAVFYSDSAASMEAGVLAAVDALSAPMFDELRLVVTDDPGGVARGVAPAAALGVSGGSDVGFTLLTDGTVVDFETPNAVTVELWGDGYLLTERVLYVDL